MTIDEAIKQIGWSYRHVAKLLGCDVTIVLRWAKEKTQAPEHIVKWLVDIAECHRQHPAPTNWKKK